MTLLVIFIAMLMNSPLILTLIVIHRVVGILFVTKVVAG